VSLSMLYLGLLLGASFKATSIWNRVIEKVEVSYLVGRNYICLRVVG
jgi:hypothetical protein